MNMPKKKNRKKKGDLETVSQSGETDDSADDSATNADSDDERSVGETSEPSTKKRRRSPR